MSEKELYLQSFNFNEDVETVEFTASFVKGKPSGRGVFSPKEAILEAAKVYGLDLKEVENDER